MKFSEIVSSDLADDVDAAIEEATPTGGVGPLTPAQSVARAKRMAKVTQNIQDVKAANAVRLQKASRKLFQL